MNKGKKIKKLFGLIKDELTGKIMTTFSGLRAKICIYSINDGSEDQKAQKSVIERKRNFEIIRTL